MAKQTLPELQLLRWSDHVPISEVQDPLGLALRGSARLANLLLFCVTSITPRARYFSFIPWSISNWRQRERGLVHAAGLMDALVLRERALVLGCIAHHDGRPCDRGGLVGSDNVSAWYAKGHSEVDLRRLKFAKNPAFDAYFNSLVNLGVFVADEEYPSLDEGEVVARSFDDLELSPLGEGLAKAYAESVGQLRVIRDICSARRRCSVRSLQELGRRGGFCELAQTGSQELKLLRDVFLARVDLPGEAHVHRRQSLLLIVEISRQLSRIGVSLTEDAFAAATYFAEVPSADGDTTIIELPPPLQDICMRWRMFYFHHYMSVALEGMFSWTVAQAAEAGLAGIRASELASRLSSKTVAAALDELLELRMAVPFAESTPADSLGRSPASTKLDIETSRLIDRSIRSTDPLSETELESLIRSGAYLTSPIGLAIPLVLFGVTLGRYAQWEETNFGRWLASTCSDPYLDLVPPLVAVGLERALGPGWWSCPWQDLARFVLARYVAQQHQSMSYEKSASVDRCLLQVEGDRISARRTDGYEKIGMGNPRFRSAMSVLLDLGLLEADDDCIVRPTGDGLDVLRQEVATQVSA